MEETQPLNDLKTLNILFIGDLVGQPGKYILSQKLKELRDRLKTDFVIANGENLAGGRGITPNLAAKVFSFGVNAMTSGNHIWKNREVFKMIESEQRLIRPLNYPQGVPGRGWNIFKVPAGPGNAATGNAGTDVCVINLMGRLNLLELDCPFQTMDRLLKNEPAVRDAKIRIVDFHAETTSEKIAMGWFLDGRVTAVIGTHTHVTTADEAVLPGGTGYITDAGMTGPHDSVLGVDKAIIIKNFVTRMPDSFRVADKDLRLNGVLLKIDPATGRCLSIERVREEVSGYAPADDQGPA